MVQLINFVIRNVEPLVFVIAGTAVLAALLSAFYFFVYSYIINKRMRNPDKKHRVKLLMPRFACIIFVVLSLLCSFMMTNKPISFGSHTFSTFWQNEFAFVQSGELYEAEEVKKNIEGDKSFEVYKTKSKYFEYTLYYNKDFNGIINQGAFNTSGDSRSKLYKECEYTLFVDYIGEDKEIHKSDYIDVDAENIKKQEYYGTGAGFSTDISDSPFVFYGSSDSYNNVIAECIVSKKAQYDKMAELEDEEYNEEDYQYLRERVFFNIEKKQFTKPVTKLIGN